MLSSRLHLLHYPTTGLVLARRSGRYYSPATRDLVPESTIEGHLKLFSASLSSARGGTPPLIPYCPKLPLKTMLRKRTRIEESLPCVVGFFLPASCSTFLSSFFFFSFLPFPLVHSSSSTNLFLFVFSKSLSRFWYLKEPKCL